MRLAAGLAAVGLLLPAAPLRAGESATAPALDARALAARIDHHLAARWRAKSAKPAALASDAEFLRRAYLDLAGRIPDILEARDFLDNPDKDKRAKLVDKLLAGERYPLHFANVWRAWLLPDGNNPLLGYNPYGIEAWLRNEFKSNTGFDEMVKAIVTGGGAAGRARRGDPNLLGFYQANMFQPEAIAGASARLFLGVKIECAQCHNHPFARWTRKQFWEFTAFFSGVSPRTPRGGPAAGEVKVPGTGKTVRARFLDGKRPALDSGEDPRVVLAEWMTGADNPFFARATVNRLWEYFVGTGLVDPVDDQREENPPSHPELLDELAKQFAAHKFDLQYLIRAITLSKAYQLSSRSGHPGQNDPRLFARVRVRGLSPEQLFDSLAVATGREDEPSVLNPYAFRAFDPRSPRAEFLRRFPNQDRRAEQQTSILQALYLMNGKLVADATSLEGNANLKIIAEAKTVRTSRRVEQLYLITLSRKPRPAELARLVKYVDKGGPSGDPAQALCDVFWALLNSSEFCVNH